MNSEASERERRADALVAVGNIGAARAALREIVATEPTAEIWLKLGALCRAEGDISEGLDSVESALALAPLDFMALLSRASLLERLGVPAFGEAYGRALAQRPQGAVSLAIDRMIAHAEACHAHHVEVRSARLSAAVASALNSASPEETRRIERFQSNSLRKTRPYHSEPSHFHFPGLVEREFHDREAFPWLAALEAQTDAIVAEFASVASAARAELVPYIQYSAHEPLDQWRPLNHSTDWTAIHLLQNGHAVEANAQHCPKTLALLRTLPQPTIGGCSPNAMFSLLAPGTSIPPHKGVSNNRLVCHLPLIIPEACWFRVGAETRTWKRGQAFVFDDTIEHEACNGSDALRVVLIVDIWHPGLSKTERDAVRALMEADADGTDLAL